MTVSAELHATSPSWRSRFSATPPPRPVLPCIACGHVAHDWVICAGVDRNGDRCGCDTSIVRQRAGRRPGRMR
jgi:hypothetical protein